MRVLGIPVELRDFPLGGITYTNLVPHDLSTVAGRLPSDGKRLLQASSLTPQARSELLAEHDYYHALERLERSDYDGISAWVEKGLTAWPDNLQFLLLRPMPWMEQDDANKIRAARDAFRELLPRANNPALVSLIENNIAFADFLLGTPELLEEADRLSAHAIANLSWIECVQGTRGCVLLEQGQIQPAIRLLKSAHESAEAMPRSKATNACYLALAESRRGNAEASEQYLILA